MIGCWKSDVRPGARTAASHSRWYCAFATSGAGPASPAAYPSGVPGPSTASAWAGEAFPEVQHHVGVATASASDAVGDRPRSRATSSIRRRWKGLPPLRSWNAAQNRSSTGWPAGRPRSTTVRTASSPSGRGRTTSPARSAIRARAASCRSFGR
ncbi:hypothetical protein AB0I60_18875 [Actinosynnema sp. NPDC050436]|uniref:hypothetical protein n=1 Tax=Actinosynnema sp. NPDC050436 TaxID=3155659 RepID=UPI0033FDDD6B